MSKIQTTSFVVCENYIFNVKSSIIIILEKLLLKHIVYEHFILSYFKSIVPVI